MSISQTATMSVSLPKDLKEHVKQRTKQEHFGTPSDYIRSLIRDDLKKNDQERLETLLLTGMASGSSVEMDSKEWKKLRISAKTQIKKHV